jgi:hypothetical protein
MLGCIHGGRVGVNTVVMAHYHTLFADQSTTDG